MSRGRRSEHSRNKVESILPKRGAMHLPSKQEIAEIQSACSRRCGRSQRDAREANDQASSGIPACRRRNRRTRTGPVSDPLRTYPSRSRRLKCRCRSCRHSMQLCAQWNRHLPAFEQSSTKHRALLPSLRFQHRLLYNYYHNGRLHWRSSYPGEIGHYGLHCLLEFHPLQESRIRLSQPNSYSHSMLKSSGMPWNSL